MSADQTGAAAECCSIKCVRESIHGSLPVCAAKLDETKVVDHTTGFFLLQIPKSEAVLLVEPDRPVRRCRGADQG